MKNVLTSLAKSVVIPFGLTAVASTADGAIHKISETFDSGTATIIISNNIKQRNGRNHEIS